MPDMILSVKNIKRKYKPVFTWVLIFVFLLLMGTDEETLAAKNRESKNNAKKEGP